MYRFTGLEHQCYSVTAYKAWAGDGSLMGGAAVRELFGVNPTHCRGGRRQMG